MQWVLLIFWWGPWSGQFSTIYFNEKEMCESTKQNMLKMDVGNLRLECEQVR